MANAVLSYDRTFGDHTFGITAGIEGQSKEMDYVQAYRRYFPSDVLTELDAGGVTGMTNNGNSYKETRRNYFGRVSYNYKERYLFEFVWREDGSYRFPKDNRYGFFPGIMDPHSFQTMPGQTDPTGAPYTVFSSNGSTQAVSIESDPDWVGQIERVYTIKVKGKEKRFNTEKSFLKIFPKQAEEIQKYIADNQVSFDSASQVMEMVKTFNK